MADVVLVYPRTRWDIRNLTTRLPLSVLYIATYLRRHGVAVEIVDQRVDDGWEARLRALLAERPAWVGISSMTGKQIRWGLAAARVVREAAPTVPLVWGGVHPSILPEQTLGHPLVDLVAVGDGEELALELTAALKGPGPADLSKIAGLAWKRGGRPVVNPPRDPVSMDELPPLDYGSRT